MNYFEPFGVNDLMEIKKRVKDVDFSTANYAWTQVNAVGTATYSYTPVYMAIGSGATANSVGIAKCYPGFMGNALSNFDFSKKMLMTFMAGVTAEVATAIAHFQVRSWPFDDAYGNLSGLGLGIKISGLSVVGESYGASGRAEVALGNLIAAKPTLFNIEHDPTIPAIKWYKGGELVGVQTTPGYIPLTEQTSFCLQRSLTNGATASALSLLMSKINAIMEL